MPPYQTEEQKRHDAGRYVREESIPWPVLIDDLRGTTHQVYGGLADPTYVLDTEGRVAYYNMWTHAPTLHQTIQALLAQEGRGVVNGGIDHWLHPGAAMTDGWRGLRRGLPQSFLDLMLAAPGSPASAWLGYQIRPLLAPLTLRATPLPDTAKLGLAFGAGLVIGLTARWLTTRK